MISIDVFRKNRRTREGKKFTTYLSRLNKKDGTSIPVQVRFKEGKELPKEFPVTISFNRSDGNLQAYDYPDAESGEIRVGYNLWLNDWMESEYVDHSLDDFE